MLGAEVPPDFTEAKSLTTASSGVEIELCSNTHHESVLRELSEHMLLF